MRRIVMAMLLGAFPLCALAMETSIGTVRPDAMVSGLNQPWSFGFLPQGGLLITEISGNLLHITPKGDIINVTGLPEVANIGQGGLLDLLITKDFSTTRMLFFTFAKPQGRSEGTAVAAARLSQDGRQLTDFVTLFELKPGSSGGRHFGSRIVEDDDGFLYVTIGDRGNRSSAQDLTNQNGTVIRISRDGSIPNDNPFKNIPNAEPAIFSFGHRNPQGAAFDGSGQLWIVEHGARGGDEVNKIDAGANYGWPVISYGRHYSGFKIGEGTEKDGMMQPAHYWDPSIAPSGMMFYHGAMFPEWRGDLFIGSLKFGLISRLEVKDDRVEEVERIQSDETGRVRDIREAPDGSIWFLSVADGVLYRVSR